MNIDFAALLDDVEVQKNLIRAFASGRTSLSEAEAEIERLWLIIRELQRPNS